MIQMFIYRCVEHPKIPIFLIETFAPSFSLAAFLIVTQKDVAALCHFIADTSDDRIIGPIL